MKADLAIQTPEHDKTKTTKHTTHAAFASLRTSGLFTARRAVKGNRFPKSTQQLLLNFRLEDSGNLLAFGLDYRVGFQVIILVVGFRYLQTNHPM